MKYIKLLLLLIFFSFIHSLSAQEEGWKFTPSIGLGTPLLDNGVALHLGLNPSYQLSNRFEVEAQASYIYSWISSSFLSGDRGYLYSVNALLGGRFYFNKADNANRFYVNLLVGGNYNQEFENGVRQTPFWSLGYSTGFYASLHKFVIGVSFDSPFAPLLKFGYQF